MVILLAVMIVGLSGLSKFLETLNDNSGWMESLEEELAQVEEQLSAPNLEEEEKAELLEREANLQADIVYAIEVSQPQTREKVILDIYGMMSFILLLMIIASAGIVASEFSQGTIKMLLSRPVKRWKILTSKYLTIVLFGLTLTVIAFVCSVASAYVFYPAVEGNTVLFFNEEVAVNDVFGKSMYLILLEFAYVLVMSTLAFMIGSVFRSSALAIGISMFLYFSGSMIVMFLQDYAIAKYILFAHNLSQYEQGYGLLDNITMPFSIAVLVTYLVVFLVISYSTFIKRDITA